MQKMMINSKRQGELYNLVEKLEYVPYPVLNNLCPDKKRFKKDFKTLLNAGYIEVVKVGHKVFIFPAGKSLYFDDRKYELKAWFYLKLIKSGGEFLGDNKIKTSVGKVYAFEVLPEIKSVKLYGEKRFIAALSRLQDIDLSFGKSFSEVEF